MEFLFLLSPFIVIISAVWVNIDFRRITGELMREPGIVGSMGPGSWTAGALLLWAIYFPLYLLKRGELKRRVAAYHALPAAYRWRSNVAPDEGSDPAEPPIPMP